MRMAITSVLVGFACTAAAACDEHNDALSKILAQPSCNNSISVRVFIHVSRHGMWVSEDPGLNGKGLVITLSEANLKDPGVVRLLQYSRDPHENGNNAFQATLNGKLICANDRKPGRISVSRITDVQLVEIRDAN